MATENKRQKVVNKKAMLFNDGWLGDINSDETFTFDSSLPNQHDAGLFCILQEGKSDSEGNRDEGQSASGLPEKNFNVLSADKKETLSIPPEFIEPTEGSKNYLAKNRNKNAPAFAFYLCKMYTNDSICAHGSRCDFIHSRHVFGETPRGKSPIKSIRVHWCSPVSSINEALYERHEPGSVIYIGEGGSNASGSCSHTSSNMLGQQSLVSDNVYKTKGSEEALQRGSKRPLRLCKHYERGKCARGHTCNFIHRVHLAQSMSEQQQQQQQQQLPPSLLPQQSVPPSIVATAPLHYNSQVAGINLVNLSQGRGCAQQVFPAGIACLANNHADCVQQSNVIAFDGQGVPQAAGGGVIVAPQFQQQKYHNTHNNNISNNSKTNNNNNKNRLKTNNNASNQQQQQSCMFSSMPGEGHLGAVWTSRRVLGAENPTTPLMALSVQGLNPFYGSQQQQQPQQASVFPISPAPEYFVPQVLLTYMPPPPS